MGRKIACIAILTLQQHLLTLQAVVLQTLQVVVLDKLDYCASLHNLDAVKDLPNFKVRPSDGQQDWSERLFLHTLDGSRAPEIMQ